MCDCVGQPGAATERLTLCLWGRESRGGRHGGVGEPAQENGVQGEAAARSPFGAHPPLPSAPPGPFRPAQRAPPGEPEAPGSARQPPPPQPRDACRPVPESWAGAGAGRRRSTKARSRGCLPPAARPPLFRERVWSSLCGTVVFVLVFINTKRGLYLKLGRGHSSTCVPV